MKLSFLITATLKAFCNLNASAFSEIDSEAEYSLDEKEEFIEQMESKFKAIKSGGVNQLGVRNSQCKFCYPMANTYSFYDNNTDEFIIRIVIEKKSDNKFIVEECRNRLLESGDNRLPF